MKRKKQIFYTGKLLVSLFILPKNGSGGLKKITIMAIIPLFILNKKELKKIDENSGRNFSRARKTINN